MVVADTDYKFTFVDIGAYRKDCDSIIFENTSFWKCVDQSLFPLPHPKSLSGSHEPYMTHVLL